MKVIIFDLGCTLVYFEGSWSQVVQQATRILQNKLVEYGYPAGGDFLFRRLTLRLDEYYQQRERDHTERGIETVLRSFFREMSWGGISQEMLRESFKAFYGITQAHWIPEEDALSTLQTLKVRGYNLALLSNAAYDEDVQTLVDKAQVRPYLDLILSSAAIGYRKPHPYAFKKVVDFFGFPVEAFLMVGDSLSADIMGARSVGIKSAWITHRQTLGRCAMRVHDEIQPDFVINNLSELLTLKDLSPHI